MISEEQLDQFRLEGTKVRVIRDADPANDIKGFVMAWNEQLVMIKKLNKKVLKLDRQYQYQSWDLPRIAGDEQ